MDVAEYNILIGAKKKFTVKKRGKFNNVIVETAEGKFDSKKEYGRWVVLKQLVKDGLIDRLERQVKYSIDINGEHICNYMADFTYYERGRKIVEDVKGGYSNGTRTDVYRVKKKLLYAIYGIIIRET